MCSYCREMRSSAVGVFLVNLCISLICLYIFYTISNFVGSSEVACKAFSFLFHYFVLVSCVALSIMAFFTGWRPFAGRIKLMSYVTAVLLNWSKYFISLNQAVLNHVIFQSFLLWWLLFVLLLGLVATSLRLQMICKFRESFGVCFVILSSIFCMQL